MNLVEATDKEIMDVLNMNYPGEDEQDRALRLQKYLRSKKFRKIGEGTYSSVWLKPGYKRVVKFNRIRGKSRFTFADYAKYCKKRKNKNPYLLKVYYTEGYDYHISIIEKLESLDQNIKKISTNDLGALIWMDIEINKGKIIDYGKQDIETMEDGIVLMSVEDSYPEVLKDLSRRFKIKKYNDVIIHIWKNKHKYIDHPLCKTIRKLMSDINMTYLEYDGKDENIMVRSSTKKLVLSDIIVG